MAVLAKMPLGGMLYGMDMLPHKTLTRIIIMHFNIKARHKSTNFTVLLLKNPLKTLICSAGF